VHLVFPNSIITYKGYLIISLGSLPFDKKIMREVGFLYTNKQRALLQ